MRVKIHSLGYCANVLKILRSDSYISHLAEPKSSRRGFKVGSLIRDGLVKPFNSSIMNGYGYDGDVEGVDVGSKDIEETG